MRRHAHSTVEVFEGHNPQSLASLLHTSGFDNSTNSSRSCHSTKYPTIQVSLESSCRRRPTNQHGHPIWLVYVVDRLETVAILRIKTWLVSQGVQKRGRLDDGCCVCFASILVHVIPTGQLQAGSAWILIGFVLWVSGFAFGSAGASSQSTTSSLLGTTAAAAASSGARGLVLCQWLPSESVLLVNFEGSAHPVPRLGRFSSIPHLNSRTLRGLVLCWAH